MGRGDICVRHREYIFDIRSSTSAFTVSANNITAINPGLPTSFPWLSAIASRYESYRFNKLSFEYIPEASSLQTGFVALLPDYDPSDPAPTTKAQALQYEGAVKCAPWQDAAHHARLEDIHKRQSFFYRSSALTAAQSLSLYDTGNLFVAVGNNVTTGDVLGGLWCSYECCLYTPQLQEAPGESAKTTSGGTVTPANPFGTAPVNQIGSVIAPYIVDSASNLTFVKDYQGLLSMVANGTSLTDLVGSGTAAFTNGTLNINGAGGVLTKDFMINALSGQTFKPTITGASLISLLTRSGEYSYNLL